MRDRRIILLLLCIGWALAVILWNMLNTMEQMEACVEFPSVETCGPSHKYKPAWDK